MQERRASLFDEDSLSVGELHTDNPSIIASEQTNSKLLFDLSDLSAERRLGVQSVGGPSKVQFLGQNDDCLKVTHFDTGEHCSTPFRQTTEMGNCPTSSKGTSEGEKAARKDLGMSDGKKITRYSNISMLLPLKLFLTQCRQALLKDGPVAVSRR
jgi:hypothetical protein